MRSPTLLRLTNLADDDSNEIFKMCNQHSLKILGEKSLEEVSWMVLNDEIILFIHLHLVDVSWQSSAITIRTIQLRWFFRCYLNEKHRSNAPFHPAKLEVYWHSIKQLHTALSNTEAEYMILRQASNQTNHLSLASVQTRSAYLWFYNDIWRIINAIGTERNSLW